MAAWKHTVSSRRTAGYAERPLLLAAIDTVGRQITGADLAIGSADAARCAAEYPCTPTSTPIASTAAAADEPPCGDQLVRRRRRAFSTPRRQQRRQHLATAPEATKASRYPLRPLSRLSC